MELTQRAIQIAKEEKGVSVISLPGDVAEAPASDVPSSLKSYVTKSIFRPNDLEIKEELLKKYYSIYQRLKDSSKVDILYIRERKKKTNDFNLIFSEIMKIREKLNLPLKRTIDVYYNERYNNIFLS